MSRLSLAWIVLFTLPPILLGWSFASLIGCGEGSACSIAGVDWAANGDFVTVLPMLTTPIGIAVLVVWLAIFLAGVLLDVSNGGRRHAFPVRPYVIALIVFSAPFVIASAALWLGFGAILLPRHLASSVGLTFARFSLFATLGMLIWLATFAIHQLVAWRIARPGQPREVNP